LALRVRDAARGRQIAQLGPTPSSLSAAKVQLSRAQNQTVTGGNLLGDITMVLFEFQKMAGKEAREEAKTATMMTELVDQQKAAKLQNDNKQIEKQMDEASQKAQNLSVQATVRGLRQRTPIPGTRAAAGPDLQRALDRFAQIQRRLAATSKSADDELKKLERR
jgi:hypothetical protein